MMRMMVGLMGSAALVSISSSVMPMMDSSTMARSSWFHLESPGHSSLSGGWGATKEGAVVAIERRMEVSRSSLPILQRRHGWSAVT